MPALQEGVIKGKEWDARIVGHITLASSCGTFEVDNCVFSQCLMGVIGTLDCSKSLLLIFFSLL